MGKGNGHMWTCPVCKEQNENGLLCAGCGFDFSLHYKKYRTLAYVDGGQESIAGILLRWSVYTSANMICWRTGWGQITIELARFDELFELTRVEKLETAHI